MLGLSGWATETTGGMQNWRQVCTFDRYANQNFNENLTTTLPKGCMDGGNPVMCGAERNVHNPTLNAANNRMAAGQGWAHDASGNVSTDPEGRTFIYDAENKQKEVRDQYNTVIGQYRFDGDGKRIKKIVPSTGEVTIFVYDSAGKLVAEYSTVVEPIENEKVAFLTADHLGILRVITNGLGQVESRRDFLAFGEQITGTVGNRQTAQTYTSTTDDIRQRFTG